MIKKIREGRKEFTVICDKCGCEFQYEIGDIYKNKVTCPECGHAVEHPAQVGKKKKHFTKENKHKVIMFLIKLAIYIALGVSIWQITAAKYKNTEKDIDENIVAEEIGEGVETVVEVA